MSDLADAGDSARPVAVVTGGTRGIGLGLVRSLASTHHVVVGGRSETAVAEVAGQLPSGSAFVADLADWRPAGSLDAALTELAERVPRVDVLVHSAGVLHRGTVAELPTDAWVESLTVNVAAVAAVTRALLPALRAARGLVLMVNSGSGFTAGPTSGAYAASKFALRALADALREEERAAGVRVTSLHPGRTDTDMQREMVDYEGGGYDRDAYLTVHAVVRAARAAIDASPEASLDVVSVRPRGYRP